MKNIFLIFIVIFKLTDIPFEKMDSGIALKDPDSFHILDIENLEINETEDGNYYLFVNEKEGMYLKAYQYEGDINYSISLFEVGILGKNEIDNFKSLNKTVLNNIDLYTSNKLKIGLNRIEVEELLNMEFKELDNKLIYKLDENILKYNMPSYYLEIEFKDDKIKRFRFGFEYT